MQTWVVKLSKLCNMRCSYCYEWNELGNPARMSLELWRKVLNAAVEYRKMQGASLTSRRSQRVLVILHGGEPLALPTEYLQKVVEAFKEATRECPGGYRLALQSNLYSPRDEKIELLLRHGVGLSVSYDGVPGVRLSMLGQPTEPAVAANIDKLRERGVPLNGIAVLAKHTVERVIDVYEFYARRRMAMRILPLFDGPAERPADDFLIERPAIVSGLERLFRHWMDTGCRTPIKPFDTYFLVALRHMVGLRIGKWDRSAYGDGVLLVNLDGNVYRVLDAYEPRLALGNIGTQSLAEILQSEAYQSSLARDVKERESQCMKCDLPGGVHWRIHIRVACFDALRGSLPDGASVYRVHAAVRERAGL